MEPNKLARSTRPVALLVVACLIACGVGGAATAGDTATVPSAPRGLLAFKGEAGFQQPTIQTQPLDGSSNRTYRLRGVKLIMSDLSISPSGKRIAFEGLVGERGDVFVLELASGSLKRLRVALASKESIVGGLAWSPDETRLAFGATLTTPCDRRLTTDTRLLTVGRDGRGLRRLKNVLPPPASPGNLGSAGIVSWSPSGRSLLYTVDRNSDCDDSDQGYGYTKLTVIPARGGRPVVVAQMELPRRPSWSPDSTKIALAPSWDLEPELRVVGVARRSAAVLGKFYADVIWTHRGIYAVADDLQTVTLVNAAGAGTTPIAKLRALVYVAAAPASGDWVASFTSAGPRSRLVVSSHSGQRLIDRRIPDYPIVAALPG